jgi:hypothetical protein
MKVLGKCSPKSNNFGELMKNKLVVSLNYSTISEKK